MLSNFCISSFTRLTDSAYHKNINTVIVTELAISLRDWKHHAKQYDK